VKIGVAKSIITPDVTNEDRPVWMAGFSMGRKAAAVHDAYRETLNGS